MAPDYASELRQDPLRQTWVACAPTRGDRPKKTGDRTPDDEPVDDDTPVEGCPFCPGHEEQLPTVLWELGAEGERPWRTRAVPNKFSALDPDVAPDASRDGLYRRRSNHGKQEVVIDTPSHHRGLPRMATGQVEAVLQTYVERYRTLRAERPALYPFVFRNHGARAGASLPHPHSQIIASDFPPPRIEREETAARERYDETGQCPYCEMIAEELSAGTRVVWTDDQFVMFVPFAAQGPYELWILPRTHEPEFGRLDAPERTSLATALQTAVRALHDRLDDPDYNFFVRTALEHETDAPHLHWSLRLQPRTSVEAGFERATGVRINPSIPERDADVLREAV